MRVPPLRPATAPMADCGLRPDPPSVLPYVSERNAMKLCVAGAAGAFGSKHLEALAAIEGVEVVSVVGGAPDDIEGLAKARRIPHWTKDLNESLALKDVDAVILATPTQLHARQA